MKITSLINTEFAYRKNSCLKSNEHSSVVQTSKFNIPSSAIKAKYCPSFGKYRKAGTVMLTDRETGQPVKAVLKKEVIGDYVSYKIYKGKEEAGYMDMNCDSILPEQTDLIWIEDNVIPEIEHLRTLDGEKYSGIGTALINAAVAESIKRGKNGNVWLCAQKGYAAGLSPYRKNENPIPFYHKLGFEALDIGQEYFIRDCLKKTEYDKLPCSTLMLLTPDAIKAKNKYFSENYKLLK